MCLLLVTACIDDDNNASQDGAPDTLEEFVEPEAEPTADAMSVTVDGLTYVFDGSYTGEGKALVARVGNRATYLASDSDKPNEEVEHIILPNDRIGNLSNADYAGIIMVLSNGGSVAVFNPTIDHLKMLVSSLKDIIATYQIGGNNVTAKYIVQMLDTEAIDRIVMWTDNFDFSVYLDSEGKGDYLSLAVFREEDSFLAYREREALTYRIWTAYSKEKNCDVYCVTQTVTAYNQDLGCGPSGARDWYDGSS